MASFEEILDSISDSSKKNFKGQVSMFDLASGNNKEENDLEKLKYNYHTLKEYSDKELLSMEKEMLGLYISGHPLEELKEQIEMYSNFSTLKIREALEEQEQTGAFPLKDGQNVKFAGIINSIKKKYTKNNKIMAFVNIEDLYGNIETIVFENAYQQAGTTLMEENIVLVEGRLSIREEEQNVTIIANKIVPLGTFPNGVSDTFGVSGTFGNQVQKQRRKLSINITNLKEEQKDKLRGALKFFAGDRNNTPVQIINIENILPAGGIFVNGTTLEEIEEIVGKENCIIETGN